MKIAVIEDEKYWRDIEVECIRKFYGQTEVDIDTYDSAKEYLESETKYDISFVDIELPEIDGFETIRRKRKSDTEGIYIILTTHTEMSRKGYIVNAFRFIDKVKLNEELEEALCSVEVLFERNKKVKMNIVGEGEIEFVLKNILYFETERHSVLIHTKSGVKRCNSKISDIEKMLDVKWFFRCHQSFIVNLDEISYVDKHRIYMNNGENIDVSKRKFSEFKTAYIKRVYECANK